LQDRIEKHKEEVEELEALEKVVEEETPKNVRVKILTIGCNQENIV
jgi:hypothetical protein